MSLGEDIATALSNSRAFIGEDNFTSKALV